MCPYNASKVVPALLRALAAVLHHFHPEACSQRGVAAACSSAMGSKQIAVLTHMPTQLIVRAARRRNQRLEAHSMVRVVVFAFHQSIYA